MQSLYFALAIFLSITSAQRSNGRFSGTNRNSTNTRTGVPNSGGPNSGGSGTNPGTFSSSGGGCPPNFKNAVINDRVNSQPNRAGRWQTLVANGISGWVGFTLNNVPEFGGPQYQLPLVMNPDSVQAGISLLQSGNVPYLGIFNEPDFEYGAGGRTSGAAEAISAAKLLFAAGPNTQFLSPGLAFPESNYYEQFFADPEVNSRVKIINAHIYKSDSSAAIAKIQSLMTRFPGKRIWVTELSPASDISQGCQLNAQQMQAWMKALVDFCRSSGVVDRIYWNTGEYYPLDSSNPANCDSSLTDYNGNATPLLQYYKTLC